MSKHREQPAATAVEFDKVSRAFGKNRVLDDVSFAVPAGSALCILGRSGTGKSVTLKLIVGLLQPDSGRVLIADRDISHLESRELSEVRQRMGFLFQSAALFDSISVGENVAFPLRRHTRLAEQEIRDQAQQALDKVGLGGEWDKMPSELSGGMRKRAGLARALVLDPDILLVDEPSAGLDPVTSREIDELLLSMKDEGETSLIVVTHNIPSARRISDHVIVLHEGRIAAEGNAEELQRCEDPLVREFMTSQHGG
jgi:phospholipid/cholesterol/gamma-HCH transport system ATP-binding protein